MKVVPAASAVSPDPSCPLKGAGGDPLPRGLSEQSVTLSRVGGSGSPSSRGLPLGPDQAAAAAAASLLLDMKGCYSRLAALVPTLPRHRRVSKVEILQHVIDYIWDLQLELQDPLGTGAPPPRGVDEPAGGAERLQEKLQEKKSLEETSACRAACVSSDDRILCR